ncbi:MAG TPA: LCP family protein [Ktedonobacteraceae bacterium]|nr:LCP family protein [Ktedonobacteraceae bacterium]
MAHADEPIQPLYPRPWTGGQKRKAIPFSPMPALEELVPRQPWGPEQASQPTEPLSHLPIPPASTPPVERVQAQTRTAQAKNMLSRYRSPRRLTPHPNRHQRPRRLSLLLVTLVLALVVLGGLGISGWYFVESNILEPLGQFFHPVNWGSSGGGPIDGRAWNLLLLGSDNDSKYAFPDLLTQVIMVVRIDPTNNHVTMVSIPRDSWVNVPGQTEMHKLDQAFFVGATPHHSFDDGLSLVRATIEQDYGIPIDRYAWVGLGGFANVINTLGGIDIDVTHPLADDSYPDDTGQGANPHDPYALKRIYLAPGPQHLNGEQALEYVRSRHADLVGDIGRTQRQQEVLSSLKKKLNVSSIFTHLRELFYDLSGKVYTDLSQNEILAEANFARSLPASSIQRLTLGPGQGKQNYGNLAQINDPALGANQDIVIPNCTNIQPVINRIFALGDVPSCQIRSPGE